MFSNGNCPTKCLHFSFPLFCLIWWLMCDILRSMTNQSSSWVQLPFFHKIQSKYADWGNKKTFQSNSVRVNVPHKNYSYIHIRSILDITYTLTYLVRNFLLLEKFSSNTVDDTAPGLMILAFIKKHEGM